MSACRMSNPDYCMAPYCECAPMLAVERLGEALQRIVSAHDDPTADLVGAIEDARALLPSGGRTGQEPAA